MFGTHISSGGKAPKMCTLAPQVPRPPTLGSQLQLPVTVSQQRQWSQSDRFVLAYGSTQSQRGSRLSPLSISQVCFHFLDLHPVEKGVQSLDQLQVSGDIDWNGEIIINWNGEIPYTTPTIGTLCGIGDRCIVVVVRYCLLACLMHFEQGIDIHSSLFLLCRYRFSVHFNFTSETK